MSLPGYRERREVGPAVRRGERRRGCRALLWTALVLGAGCAAAEAQDAQKQPAPELQRSLKGKFADHESWELVGPNAAECVRFEPEGLRIVLPLNHPGEGTNTGVKINAAAKGDFEITVSFEILKEPDEADAGKRPATLKVIAHLNSPHKFLAGFSRRMAPGEGPQFAAWLNVNNPQVKKPGAFRAFPTKATKGRLRLVRTGAVVAYHVAEDDAADFTYLHQFPFGDEDLQAISLVGSTGGPQHVFDVRLTDLCIRAVSVASAPAPSVQPAPGAGRSRAMAFTACLLIAVVLAGIWLYVRRNSSAETASPRNTPAERDEL
jgi:hypothetical protein